MKLHISNMNMTTFKPFLLLISLLALAFVSSSVPLRALSKGEIGEYVRSRLDDVLYLDVQTGNTGTTSNVSITLGDYDGHNVTIPNLVDWDSNPLTPPDHVYFQAGQLDKLVGTVNLDNFTSQVCSINITITGTGSSPCWFLDEIEMRSTAWVIGTFIFVIEELLSPNNNYNVYRPACVPSDKRIMTGRTKASLAI